MSNLLPFKKRPASAKLLPIIIVALVIGGIVGFYVPDLASLKNKVIASTSEDRMVGDIRGYAVITDGDTIKINGELIRFHGIDAPEIDQPCWVESRRYQCGIEARAYLNTIINNQIVNCFTLSTDQYGRIVARCYNHKNEDIEAQMVIAGMATAYTYYSYDYLMEELQARWNGTGIWTGEFENPYDYRRNTH
ncbi:MAG: thermonuclease family protein [Emcibacteraceae bacterium]